MIGKRKSSSNIRRVGRSEADLGQKEAELEKTQAELEKASEAQLSHMEGGKAAKTALKKKLKLESK
jgi:hypothetical protein